MKKNFVVTSTVEIECGGEVYDLHNDFDCSSIAIDPIEKSLTFSWRPLAGEVSLDICFESFDMLMLRGVDAEAPRSEDRRLSFLGYVHPEDIDLMDGFLPEDLAQETFHFIVCFEGGMAVKLRCEAATLSKFSKQRKE